VLLQVFDFSRLKLAKPFEGGRTRGLTLLIPKDFHLNRWANSWTKKLLFVASSSALFLLGSVMAVSSADIVGTIVNPAGAPMTGVTVAVQNQSGAAVGSGVTDETGQYVIHGLVPGIYTLISKGQSAVAYVGDQGLTVDWGVAPNSQVIAAARQGTAQPAVSSTPNSR
jgi:hypothetical protein